MSRRRKKALRCIQLNRKKCFPGQHNSYKNRFLLFIVTGHLRRRSCIKLTDENFIYIRGREIDLKRLYMLLQKLIIQSFYELVGERNVG